LEARWAVFYDTLGIKWEYEKEGFNLGNGLLYLPDFYIPHLNCWIETKGEYPSKKDEEKLFKLSEQTEKTLYLFVGQIPNYQTLEISGPSYDETESSYMFASEGWDLHHVWCQCPDCGLFGIEFDARTDRLPCKKGNCQKHSDCGDKGYNGNSPALVLAYRAARQARFEYGE
jgi:hypothetical protein